MMNLLSEVTPTDLPSWLGWLGTILAACFAAFERYKGQRAADKATSSREQHAAAEAVLTAEKELTRIARESAEAWKARWETEHAEYADYRKEAHEKANRANDIVQRFAAENAELKAKTDITPLINFSREQSKFNEDQGRFNAKVVEGLDAILKRLHSDNGKPQTHQP